MLWNQTSISTVQGHKDKRYNLRKHEIELVLKYCSFQPLVQIDEEPLSETNKIEFSYVIC